MNVWTYRRPFSAQGEVFIVQIEAGIAGWRSRLMIGHQELVRDETILLGAAFDFRNHRLCHTLPDGSKLEIEITTSIGLIRVLGFALAALCCTKVIQEEIFCFSLACARQAWVSLCWA